MGPGCPRDNPGATRSRIARYRGRSVSRETESSPCPVVVTIEDQQVMSMGAAWEARTGRVTRRGNSGSPVDLSV